MQMGRRDLLLFLSPNLKEIQLETLFFLMLLLGVIVYAVHPELLRVFRPEEYAAKQQRAHELELAKIAARSQARGNLLGGVGGAAAKILFDVVTKGKGR
jgi:hypothetical protein